LTDLIEELVLVLGPLSIPNPCRFGPLKPEASLFTVYMRVKVSPTATVCLAEAVNCTSWLYNDRQDKRIAIVNIYLISEKSILPG